MKRIVGYLLFALLLVTGCGKSGGTGTDTPPVEAGKVTLFAWGAPWCGPCKKELSGVSDALNNDPQLKGKVKAVLYVPMGGGVGSPSYTDDQIKSFGNTSAPGFEVRSDQNWDAFTKYVKGGAVGSIPADVIVDTRGGATVFSQQTQVPNANIIITFLKSAVK